MLNFSPSTLNFPVNWQIKIEPVYRIFNKIEYLDDFIENGNLFISCLDSFKNYKDEMQGDNSEGNFTISATNEKGDVNSLIYEGGLNAFILCATTELNDSVIKDFNGVCALKIKNSAYFALEIAKKLPYITAGVEGKCDYRKNKNLYFEKDSFEEKLFNSMKYENSIQSHAIINQIVGGNEIFTKHLKYSHQKEYRFSWFSKNKITSNIIINCIEAKDFCEPIYF